IRDLMNFIKYYLEGNTLHRCALATGMDYKCTAVNWASYIRELFCHYVHQQYQMIYFMGDVEIDKSLFGRKMKYKRGNPRGLKLGFFGIIERESNIIILYLVDNCDANTLIPIIQRHVSPGSRIFSDSWAAYLQLNSLGYEHYSVCHKTNFNKKYKNVETGEIINCCTNQIEGVWKICKDHFRKINGTNTKMFEQHVAEIIYEEIIPINKIFMWHFLIF
ncbi:LOW QUALITY PROTEIN: uncharacterized protein LOC121368516, partial [Gigantopelta aegis]|uniref:LOW QUALITY PROTEIN: uncharacterized protein LOC121368516 n=1 Tax=Gigantopelta aegis TaxID=1735272 RepID=UPI001B88DFD1